MLRMATLALPSAPNLAEFLRATAPPAHGSVVVADSLMSACPGNGYCVAASFILKGHANSRYLGDGDLVQQSSPDETLGDHLQTILMVFCPSQVDHAEV